MEAILAQLVGGALGGVGGGAVVKDSSLGSVGNLIAGAVGGVGGGSLLGPLLGLGAVAAAPAPRPRRAASTSARSPRRWWAAASPAPSCRWSSA